MGYNSSAVIAHPTLWQFICATHNRHVQEGVILRSIGTIIGDQEEVSVIGHKVGVVEYNALRGCQVFVSLSAGILPLEHTFE